MKNKTISIFVIAIMAVAATGCGGQKNVETIAVETTVVQETTKEETTQDVSVNLDNMDYWESELGYKMLYDDSVFMVDGDSYEETFALLDDAEFANQFMIKVSTTDEKPEEVLDGLVDVNEPDYKTEEVELGKTGEKCISVSYTKIQGTIKTFITNYLIGHGDYSLIVEVSTTEAAKEKYGKQLSEMLNSFNITDEGYAYEVDTIDEKTNSAMENEKKNSSVKTEEKEVPMDKADYYKTPSFTPDDDGETIQAESDSGEEPSFSNVAK